MRGTLSVLAITVVLAGCDGLLVGPSEPATSAAQASLATVTLPNRLPGYEHANLAVATELRGYGGRYSDEFGNLHIQLTDMSYADEAKAKFASIGRSAAAGHGAPASPNAEIVVHQSRYDFNQLLRFKYLARPALLRMPGTVSLGIDISNNALHVGVRSQVTAARVTQTLTALGIPSDALRIELGAVAERTRTTLSDSIYPLIRGIKAINYWVVGTTWNIDECSTTLVGTSDNVGVVLGASHCSGPHFGGIQDGELFQPDQFGRLVGEEYQDPPWQNYQADSDCGFNSSGQPYYCRYSDAALWQLAPGAEGYLGRIARTEFYRSGAGIHGSKIIDTSQPYFPVIAEYGWAQQGDFVHKMGFRTGWTMNQVTLPCVDTWNDEQRWFLYCQQEVANAADEVGDSGGPAFMLPAGVEQPGYNPGDAAIVGIAWGKSQTGFFYSVWYDVEMELGDIVLW